MKSLVEIAKSYLQTLCLDIPDRRVGSAGNRQATTFFAETLAGFGFQVESPAFDCLDWRQNGASLTVNGRTTHPHISPYSLGCDITAPLHIIQTIADLENADVEGQLLLLMGDIAQEQLMPKNIPFYNPDHHQHIISLLEAKRPSALITATGRNPELAGALYPFPLIEDGDFDIPSVYLTEEAGAEIARFAGQTVSLKINAERRAAVGYNVIAHKGQDPHHRFVVTAHIDAKDNTPGALDNSTGIVILLLLAELLADYDGIPTIEIVTMNGEDHYSAQGHKEYIRANQDAFDQINLAINMDVAGYNRGLTEFSLYGCPEAMAQTIRAQLAPHPQFKEGQPWYQSDHSIFIQNNTPALALTSEHFMWLSTHVTHTPKDHLSLVDAEKVAQIALTLRELLLKLTIPA